jgi:signal transduction histidine kinase
MIIPDLPKNELDRLQALRSYHILDTLSEKEYDQLTAMSSQICGCKMSFISLIDEDRQWFKSAYGLEVTGTSREVAFCAHAINNPNEIMVVPDARVDDRFHDNPLVVGDPHLAFYAGVPLVNEEGMALGTLCVLDSEPKMLNEGQLQALNALADQVMALLELRKSKRGVEEMLRREQERSRELEQFAFIAAHDLKSPLNGIVSMSEHLIANNCEGLSSEALRMLSSIQGASSQLATLINGLLDYHRLDTTEEDVKSPVHRAEIQAQLTELFGGDSTVDLSFSIEPISVNTYGPVLLQVLLNLVSNAVKYGDKTSTSVHVAITETPGLYEVTVTDNGPGIDPKFHDKLFQLFETAAPADRYGNRGNGIGLAIVKKHIVRLGGTIEFQSQQGKGTTFTFTLPR